ncbi:hypothetical protein JAAARDRAFT_499284 [Jaapia argillacea MUCL 33604]|uniref:Uncharacterized protein n=1 Tax=Jaapia argillacea MUCL 33604 TaxID=933084 RepID=A0A067PD54_9AGAM|nr:hypothetical protein JAAARDRAFT_499284 [Jaapia argillacea MUCL 33604]
MINPMEFWGKVLLGFGVPILEGLHDLLYPRLHRESANPIEPRSSELLGFGVHVLDGLYALLQIDGGYDALRLCPKDDIREFAESLALDVKYLSLHMPTNPDVTTPEELIRWILISFWSCSVWNSPISIPTGPFLEVELQALVASLPKPMMVSPIPWKHYLSAQFNIGNSSGSTLRRALLKMITLSLWERVALSLGLKVTIRAISARRSFILACRAFLVYQMGFQRPYLEISPWAQARCRWACDYFGRKLLTILPHLQYSSAQVEAFRAALALHKESSHDLISSFNQSIWAPSTGHWFPNFTSASDVFARAFCRRLEDIPVAWCRYALLVWLQERTSPYRPREFYPFAHLPFSDPLRSPHEWDAFATQGYRMSWSRIGHLTYVQQALICGREGSFGGWEGSFGGWEGSFGGTSPLAALVNMVRIVIFAMEDTSRCMDGVEEIASFASPLLFWEEDNLCRAVVQVKICHYAV